MMQNEWDIKDGVLQSYNGHEEKVIVPDGITIIGSGAFSSSGVESVVLPESLETIEYNAFSNCPNLVKVVCSSNIRHIEMMAFFGCKNLSDINISTSAESIHDTAFQNCYALADKDGFVIVNGKLVQYVGDSGDVIIPDEVTHIAAGVFREMGGGRFQHGRPSGTFKTIHLPSGLKDIGDEAFAFCKDLTNIQLPNSLETIGRKAFFACIGLKEIRIPASVVEIKKDAFLYSFHLESIHVSEQNTHYTDKEGVLLSKDEKTLIYFPENKPIQSINIQTGIVDISENAFAVDLDRKNKEVYKTAELKEITIPESVKSIGANAFSGRLASRIITPAEIEEDGIGENVFDGCFPKTETLIYPELSLKYVSDKDDRYRLAYGYCLAPEEYEGDYAKEYAAFVKRNRKTILNRAKKAKLNGVIAFFENDESGSKKESNYAKLGKLEKVKVLEETIIKNNLKEVQQIVRECAPFEFTARALGYACLIGNLDIIKLLLKNGASFNYKDDTATKRNYKTSYKSSTKSFLANYSLYIADTGKNIILDSPETSARNLHFAQPDMYPDAYNSYESRALIAEYLLTQKKADFDAGNALYYSILWDCEPVAKVLSENGIHFTDETIEFLSTMSRSPYKAEFVETIINYDVKTCAKVLKSICEQLDYVNKKLMLGNDVFEKKQSVFLDSAVFEILMKHADSGKWSKNAIIKKLIKNTDVGALSAAAEHGWIKKAAQVDELLNDADISNQSKLWLLEYSNVHFGQKQGKQKPTDILSLDDSEGITLSAAELKKIWATQKRDDGSLVITGYKGDDEEVVVPDRIGKATVSVIGEKAFSPKVYRLKTAYIKNRKQIRSVTIPKSIEIIENRAFLGCENLETIEGLENVSQLEEGILQNCPKLHGENGYLIINDALFRYSGEDVSPTLSNGIKVIREYAFSDSCVETVIIPDSVKTIGDLAFRECKHLIKVELPNGIREISNGMFFGCTAIGQINLPKSILQIGKYSFQECEKLTEIIIPEGVTQIPERAFKGCLSLSNVSLPSSLLEIGEYAFYGCKSLAKISIPDSVESIDGKAFWHSDVVIYAHRGTYAAEFAEQSNIPLVIV